MQMCSSGAVRSCQLHYKARVMLCHNFKSRLSREIVAICQTRTGSLAGVQAFQTGHQKTSWQRMPLAEWWRLFTAARGVRFFKWSHGYVAGAVMAQAGKRAAAVVRAGCSSAGSKRSRADGDRKPCWWVEQT